MNATKRTRVFILIPLLFTFALGIRTLASSGIWMHLVAGRHIAHSGITKTDPFSFATTAEQVWYQSTWLYDLLVFALWQLGHAPLLIIAHAFLATLALWFAAKSVRNKVGDMTTGAAILLTSWLWAPQLSPNPLIAVAPIITIFILWLDRPALTVRRIAAFAVLQILWTNMHISFLLGPAMAAISALQFRKSKAEDGKDPMVQRLILAAVLLIATVANPYGLRLPALALQRLAHGNLLTFGEWASPFAAFFDYSGGRYLVTAVLVIVASGFIFVRQRLPLLATSIAVAAAFLLVRSNLFSAFAAIALIPFLALSLKGMADVFTTKVPLLRPVFALLILLLSAFSAFAAISNRYYAASGNASRFGASIQEDVFPTAIVRDVLPLLPPETVLINLPADGGYLAWTRPDVKIFSDTRPMLYGPKFYDVLQKMLSGEEESTRIFNQQWKPDAILINCIWPGAGEATRALLNSKSWSLAYFDGTSALFIRGRGATLPLLGNRQLQLSGLQAIEQARENFNSLSATPARLIGAAEIFRSIGRHRECETVTAALVQGAPRLTTAWRDWCSSLIAQGRTEQAAEILNSPSAHLTPAFRAWLLETLSKQRGQSAHSNISAQPD